MDVNTERIQLLAKAADTIKPGNFDDYFELRRLLASPQSADRADFRRRFAKYYGLNNGGLTDDFKREYFQLLFAFRPNGQEDPYTPLLLALYPFPRRKRDQCLQCSFVSKLVAIHDESRPLYDVNVSRFFGMAPPAVGSVEFRIAGFVANMRRIQTEYELWATDSHFAQMVESLIRKHPKLGTCHLTRLCDFLVWAVGANELK